MFDEAHFVGQFQKFISFMGPSCNSLSGNIIDKKKRYPPWNACFQHSHPGLFLNGSNPSIIPLYTCCCI